MPYTGVQFVAILEFAGIATQVGQEFSAALAGQQTVAEALAKAQTLTADEMEAAGYQGLGSNRLCTERLIRSVK